MVHVCAEAHEHVSVEVVVNLQVNNQLLHVAAQMISWQHTTTSLALDKDRIGCKQTQHLTKKGRL